MRIIIVNLYDQFPLLSPCLIFRTFKQRRGIYSSSPLIFKTFKQGEWVTLLPYNLLPLFTLYSLRPPNFQTQHKFILAMMEENGKPNLKKCPLVRKPIKCFSPFFFFFFFNFPTLFFLIYDIFVFMIM